MNPNTGDLRAYDPKELMPEDFVQVPDELKKNALRRLMGKSEVRINLRSNSKLAVFARSERKSQRERNRKQMAKASKKRNR